MNSLFEKVQDVNEFIESFETWIDGDSFYLRCNNFVDIQQSKVAWIDDDRDAEIIEDCWYIRPHLAHTFLPWASLEKYIKQLY